jgi:hypothetical protein
MARLAYLLLCHKDPRAVLAQARMLAGQGDALVIHVDGRAEPGVFSTIRDGLAGLDRVAFARRVKCGWGEWSLVQATLNMIDKALERFPFTTHFHLVSGECMPIKPARYIQDALDADDRDWIETRDFYTSGWIKTGLTSERLEYRHWVNERSQKKLFYLLLAAQKKLGWSRNLPKGLRPVIGSQWWCLRRGTIEKIVRFLKERPDVVRFFRTTWIPDETFFQSLVAHLVPRSEITDRPPTFLMFTDYGLPVTFHRDHLALLANQPEFFARKVPTASTAFRSDLADRFKETTVPPPNGQDGRRAYEFTALQGRAGRRFAPRIWEAGQSVGAGRLLLIVVSKKWHAARRLGQMLHDAGGPRSYGYVFDGDAHDLPDMGGYEKSLNLRLRHRRAFLAMLAELERTDRMTICIDPSNLAALVDLQADECTSHVLEMEFRFDEDYLIGHSDRVGLNGSALPAAMKRDLAAQIESNFRAETLALRRLRMAASFRIAEGDNHEGIGEILAGFSGIHPERARFIAEDPALFA